MRLKLITIEELFGKPKPPTISKWYFIDAIVLFILYGICLIGALKYSFLLYVSVIAFALFLCMPFFRRLYEKAKPTPKPLRIVGIAFRSILLLAYIVILVLLCHRP